MPAGGWTRPEATTRDSPGSCPALRSPDPAATPQASSAGRPGRGEGQWRPSDHRVFVTRRGGGPRRSPTPRAGRREPRAPRLPRPPHAPAAPRAVAPDNRGTPDGASGPISGARAGGLQEAWMETPEGQSHWSGASDGPRKGEKKLKRGTCPDLSTSPKLDRYKIARQLTEKAIKEKKIFSIYGHYPVIREALYRKGWVEKKFHFVPKNAPSTEEEAGAESRSEEAKENHEAASEKMEDIHDMMSRLVKSEMPSLLWTIKRDVVDQHSLSSDQMLNHYGKTASFTTKIGLCLTLRNLPWYVQADHDTFFPRCYGLCSQSEKQDFLDDFRRTVASSILKWVVSHQTSGRPKHCAPREEPRDPGAKKVPEDEEQKPTSLSGQLVDAACRVCQTYLGQLEHEDIDLSEEASRDLSEDEWKDLTQKYYSLIHGKAFISNPRTHVSQCQALLNKISSVNPQTEIDGLRNIWIIKPAAKSRGRDIICMNRVEEILELVAADHPPNKDTKWVVQKYIETPLLIYDTKFDIRQWFLVTDWNPLTIWFYKESYLRFSTQRFSLDNLDSAIHLCNNSIQKRLKNDRERSPLLPWHNMWTSTRFQEYLQKRGRGAVWGSVIYPAMKRAIANTMRVAQDRVEARKNSFELYGADFVLGRDFKPWLIEINSSPTMHPSTPVTAQLCAQVQEDTIKVVLDRKLDRDCDIGNFELLWRQPAVDLPPFHSSDLCVEGFSMRRTKKPVLTTTTFSIPPPLLEIQQLKVRCSSTMLDLTSSTPVAAAQQDPRGKEAKGLSCRLPEPLVKPADRGLRGKPGHVEASGYKTVLPAYLHYVDNKSLKAGLPRTDAIKHRDLSTLQEHSLASMLPSVKVVDGALLQPARASGLPPDVQMPCLVCRGSVPPAQPCKRCRSFCASVLQGAAFVPLGCPWTP
ncbi:protein monoglycylase TTLL8 [Sorex fumeus]|uniref:protein monoglycylase TTLL8 n=1 Tax=Sorex fumeus TaxID=62283 RepID=UPI0024ADFDBF|nr:protein monoglycylase TTLL8 [Sorex fumeus]